jgi:hypothetical protein
VTNRYFLALSHTGNALLNGLLVGQNQIQAAVETVVVDGRHRNSQ